MKAKYIYEKFTQDSDPIKDMNIGMIAIIKDFFKNIIASDNFSSMGQAVSKDVNDIDNLLIMSVETSKYDFVECLLTMGADIHTHGETNHLEDVPLRYAIFNNDITMIDLLLKYDANILKAIDKHELHHSMLGEETVKHVKKILKKQKL